jgi:hypothetical protein
MSTEINFYFLQMLGLIFVGLFLILGAIDGLYFHLIKYQLHRHAESRLEHIIHSARGVLLGLMGISLFSTVPLRQQFLRLACLCVIIALDLVLEIIDIYVEKRSRRFLGGISSTEMVLHVFASSFRMAAIALLVVSGAMVGFSLETSLLGKFISLISILISLAGLLNFKSASAVGQHPLNAQPS